MVPVDIAADGLCDENWICNALELSKLQPDDLDDDAESGLSSTAPPMTAEKSKINYVLNK